MDAVRRGVGAKRDAAFAFGADAALEFDQVAAAQGGPHGAASIATAMPCSDAPSAVQGMTATMSAPLKATAIVPLATVGRRPASRGTAEVPDSISIAFRDMAANPSTMPMRPSPKGAH